MLFAGIDGGQSGSRIVLADERGEIVAQLHGQPLFVSDSAKPSAGIAEIAALLRHARLEAKIPAEETVQALVAGLSGQDDGVEADASAIGAVRARLVHDAEIAHAGALGGEPGIVLVAGSGSVAFGTDAAGNRARRGGWGHTFGDDGSAFWIGRRAISAAMHAEDQGVETRLGSAACDLFAAPTLRALQNAARRGSIAPSEIAGFAPSVLTLAQENDEVAAGVFREAVTALCDLVVVTDRALEPMRARAVSFGGKVFSDRVLRTAWRQAVEFALPQPRVVPPRASPVIGAVMLAFHDAGVEPPARLLAAGGA